MESRWYNLIIMDKNIIIKLQEAFSEIFNYEIKDSEFKNLKMGDFSDWDSMGHYTFLLAIEDKFNLRFSTQQLTDLTSISEIIDFLKSM